MPPVMDRAFPCLLVGAFCAWARRLEETDLPVSTSDGVTVRVQLRTAAIKVALALRNLPKSVLALREHPSDVLSLIDAAAGRVEVVRHWPAAPADVDLYPFMPYFWDSCGGVSRITPRNFLPPLSPTHSPPAGRCAVCGKCWMYRKPAD